MQWLTFRTMPPAVLGGTQIHSRMRLVVPNNVVFFSATLLRVVVIITCGVLRCVKSAVCDPQSVSLEVDDVQGVQDLALALGCSGGNFDVTWIGSIDLEQALVVNDGTSLTISGDTTTTTTTATTSNSSSASSLSTAIADGTRVGGPLFIVSGLASVLRLRDITVTGGSGVTGGAVLASNGAVVDVADCSFSENYASSNGGNVSIRSLPAIRQS